MNNKKILILLLLFFGVMCLCLAPASAGSKTVKMNDNKWKYEEYLSPSPNSQGWVYEEYKKVGSKKYYVNIYQMTSKKSNYGYKNIGFMFRSNKKIKKVVLYNKGNNNKVIKLTAKGKKESPIYIGFTSRYISSKHLNKYNNYSPYKYKIYY